LKVLAISSIPDKPETTLLIGLKRAGVDLRVILQAPGERSSALEAENIPVEFMRFKSRLDFGAVLKLRPVLKRERFEIIHSFNSRALSCAIFASLGIATKHVAYRGTAGNIHRYDPAAWLTYLNPKVSKILCISEAIKQSLLNRVPEEKLARIYKGHSPSWYQNVADFQLSQIGIPPGAITVCCTANIRPVKGVDILLKAAKKLSQIPNLHFLLIGEVRDPKVQALIDELKPQGKLHAAGFVKDPLPLVKASDISIMASIEREGFPKAVLESMSLGIVPIVTAVGGMPEMVKNLESGLVVPPSDVDALAEAIQTLVNDPALRRKLGTEAKRSVAANFPIENTITQVLEMYRSLLT